MMKKALFVLLTVLPLAAFPANDEGMPEELKQFFADLTDTERDSLGREVAASMRKKNTGGRYSNIRITDTRYRASDDTFVISAKLKQEQDSAAGIMQSAFERKMARTMREEMCDDDKVRDLMTIGRYAFEYRITTAKGKTFKPVRIGAEDCE